MLLILHALRDWPGPSYVVGLAWVARLSAARLLVMGLGAGGTWSGVRHVHASGVRRSTGCLTVSVMRERRNKSLSFSPSHSFIYAKLRLLQRTPPFLSQRSPPEGGGPRLSPGVDPALPTRMAAGAP